jgi:hypothetical protein
MEIDKSKQLGEELVKLLENSGVNNLQLELDGTISGNIGSDHFKSLKFELHNDSIDVTGIN